ncbi:hypothetical protein LZ30DRAFT_808156 [Colletotrichum cereale]|nr:hypothetical protein LZ30DRAFT_808156 [Colletotrichum cereale]
MERHHSSPARPPGLLSITTPVRFASPAGGVEAGGEGQGVASPSICTESCEVPAPRSLCSVHNPSPKPHTTLLLKPSSLAAIPTLTPPFLCHPYHSAVRPIRRSVVRSAPEDENVPTEALHVPGSTSGTYLGTLLDTHFTFHRYVHPGCVHPLSVTFVSSPFLGWRFQSYPW